MEKAVQALEQQLAAGRAERDRERAVSAAQITTLQAQLAAAQADLERERGEWLQQLASAQATHREQLTAVRTELEQAKVTAADQRSRADRAEGVIEGLRTARSTPSAIAAWWRAVREAFRP